MNRVSRNSFGRAGQLIGAAAIFGILAAVVLVPSLHRSNSGPSPAASGVPQVVGAIQDPSFSPGPATSTAVSAPTPDSSACRTIITYQDRPAPSVKTWSAASDAVVNASVVAVGAGRWATADGSMPRGEPTATDVYRVVTIRIGALGRTTSAGLGKVVVSGQLNVRILGGKVGCSLYLISGQAEVTVGQSAIWFLTAKAQPPLAAAPAQQMDAIDNWPIVNGSVVAPDGTTMAPSALLATSLSQ